MNELVNYGIKLSNLKINIGFINGLPKKWLSFYQSLRNTNHVNESELASLFGKLKDEENLIDSMYESEKKKSFVTATPCQLPSFQPLFPSQQKPELRPNKDFHVKYNNFKAKLALLSSGTSYKSLMVKNKGLITKAYDWDEEYVSSDDNEMTEVKVLMALVDDESVAMGMPEIRNRILPAESQVKLTDPSATIIDSSADESLVCSTPLLLLEKLVGAKPVFGPKTIKSILKSNSTFKEDTLKGVTVNEPSSAPAKGNKNGSDSKNNLAPAGKLKNVKTKDDSPLGEALQAKKAKAFQSKMNESSNARRSKTPTKRWVLKQN
nr:hypothetical protein [Tanacetum cinerariifolium]